MRNLKKVLSLVLCLAMMLSIMVVGAGAAYPDVDEIENLDAVYTLTALGIVEGRDTGNFDPGATLSRAEAAKLVACLNLGQNPVPNANGVSSFTDVVNTPNVAWANNYIEYGVAQGSINGVGGNRFAPNSEVTGVQLAKMLLGLLGWNAAKEGYTGALWEYNVNIDAVTANLYKGLEDIDPTAPITRDDAAQMMYNALLAHMVIYLTNTTGALDITSKKLIDEKYPNVTGDEGIMTAISYDAGDAEYTYTVGEKELTTAVDYTDLLGQNVVWFTDRVAGDEVVLGIYDYYNTVETGLYGDLDLDADDLDADFGCAEFQAAHVGDVNEYALDKVQGLEEQGMFHDYYEYKLIDNGEDGDWDTLIVYPILDKDVTVSNKDGITAGGVAYEYEDCTIAQGLAVGDVAMIKEDTTLKVDYIISELALEKGTVNHFTSVYHVITKMTIGSTDYNICSTTDHQKDVYPQLAGKKVTFNVINGYAVNVKIDSSIELSELLLVTSLGESYDSNYTYSAKAMFSDGVIRDITISKLNGSYTNITEIARHLENTSEKYGYLAKYDEVNGVYELTSMDRVNSPLDLGFDNTTHIFDGTFAPATRGGDDAGINVNGTKIEFADDAIIYLADVSGNETVYSVATGADMATLTNGGAANVVYYAGYEKAADGHNYITFAFIKTDSVSESADNYGILTSDVEWFDYNDKGVDYATFSIWNGTEEVTITAEVGEMVEDVAYVEGDVIVYSTNDGKIINMDAVVGYVDSIISYNPNTYGGELTTEGGIVTVPADAVVISSGKGVSADLIPAEKDLNEDLIKNVFIVLDDNDEAVLLVVDNDGVEINGINLTSIL